MRCLSVSLLLSILRVHDAVTSRDLRGDSLVNAFYNPLSGQWERIPQGYEAPLPASLHQVRRLIVLDAVIDIYLCLSSPVSLFPSLLPIKACLSVLSVSSSQVAVSSPCLCLSLSFCVSTCVSLLLSLSLCLCLFLDELSP